MANPRACSIVQGLESREITGFRVRKRSFFDESSCIFNENGVISIDHGGINTPPLSISFCKGGNNSHILAVSDEDGWVSVYDTRRKFAPASSSGESLYYKCTSGEKHRLYEWVAHMNAVFDICWIKDDTRILTASGDQTIKLWDSEVQACVGILSGHTASVKCLSPHSSNPDIFVSGSRDGSFALWDLRCASSKTEGLVSVSPTASAKKAHVSPHGKRVRQNKAASMSITSVIYLKDDVSIATAGAVDSVVKFWDTRNLKSLLTQSRPYAMSPKDKEQRLHGVSSLSQDANGVFLSASCMDSKIYLYDVLHLEKGPIKTFKGSRIQSFFVKSSISPDGTHILGGSCDGNAYMWKVNKPGMDPVALRGHEGEVTSVEWCPLEPGKVVTASDDFTVRLWGMHMTGTVKRRASGFRRRVMAIPTEDCIMGPRDPQPDLSRTTKTEPFSYPDSTRSGSEKAYTRVTKLTIRDYFSAGL